MEMGERKMEYIRLFWEHDLADEPTSMLYEVDTQNDRLAARSIDIFRNGNIHKIPDLYAGAIEITPIPTVEEFGADLYGEEFRAFQITEEEFEAVWNA